MIILIKKLSILLVLILCLQVLVTGCAKQENEEYNVNEENNVKAGNKANVGNKADEVIYVAEFHSLRSGGFWIHGVMPHEGFLYLYADKLLKISLEDGEIEELNLFPFDDHQYIRGISITPAGNFILLAGKWSEETGDSYIMYEASKDGELISQIDLDPTLDIDADSYFQNMYSDKQGNHYFTIYNHLNGTSQILKIDSSGKLLGKLGHNALIDGIGFFEDEVYISTGGSIKKADFHASSIGVDIRFDDISGHTLRLASGSQNSLLVSNGSGLYECDIENGTAASIVEFIDCDINPNDISYFGEIEGGNYWLLNQTYLNNGTKSELIIIKQIADGELPPRKHLTFGASFIRDDVKEAIINFNKTNEQYRIRTKEYRDDDFEAGIIRLQNDLESGVLDIVDPSMLGFYGLAMKGAFHDLNNYFDKSELINRADYFENALGVYEIDGKLLGVMTSFSLVSLVGSDSRLAGITQWDVAEMVAWAEKYPDAKLLEKTSSSVLSLMLEANQNMFIDWQGGKCDFVNDDFLAILEFASNFGHDEAALQRDNPERPGTYEALKNGAYLLMESYVGNLNSMQLDDAFFDGEASYVGYPTGSGTGIFFSPYCALAISENSRYKDGAFAFIEYLLSEDFQLKEYSLINHYYSSIPIMKKAVNEYVASQTTVKPDDIDPSGNEISRLEYFIDDLSVNIYLTRNLDYVESFYELLSLAGGLRDYNIHVNKILEEEAGSYFAGQKDALAVAEIIQNRVQVYVNENR